MTALDLRTSDHPFMRLWRTYAAAMVAWLRGPAHDCPERDRLQAAWVAAERAIVETPADDATGALVKLWTAWDGMCDLAARDEPESEIAALRGALDALEAALGAPSSRLEHGGPQRLYELAGGLEAAA